MDLDELEGYAKRHYAQDEIAALSAREGIDILLVHDAPKGAPFDRHRRGAGYVSEAAGLDGCQEPASRLLLRTPPRTA